MQQTYRVLKPEVVADVIDGEAVIMNLKSGQYYSSQGTGSDCWEALAAGHSIGQIVDRLSGVYSESRETIEAAVESFVAELVANGLVEPNEAPPASGIAHLSVNGTRFEPPVLHAYSDMQDLLMLDPIHDVDAAGWPMPKSDATA